MAETLFRGGRACIPAVPREGLSESLIDPAVAWLQAHGCELICGRRIIALRYGNDRVIGLETTEGPMPIEAAVLAVPPWVAADLVPDVTGPNEFQAILNIHFRIDVAREPPGFIGIVGGTAEWVFVKREHVSVTISAANRMVDQDAEAIATSVWPDVRTALRLEGRMPRMARGEGTARHVCRHRGTGDAAAWAAHRPREPGAGRRLDRHRVAGDDRRCHQVGPRRGRGVARDLSACMPHEISLISETAPDERLHDAIARACAALARRQHADGHWLFELEADATIPAEYVLLEHFLDRIEPELEAKIGVYLRVDPGRARRLAAVP